MTRSRALALFLSLTTGLLATVLTSLPSAARSAERENRLRSKGTARERQAEARPTLSPRLASARSGRGGDAMQSLAIAPRSAVMGRDERDDGFNARSTPQGRLSRRVPRPGFWGDRIRSRGSASYVLSSDFAQVEVPRIYSHRAALSGTLGLLENGTGDNRRETLYVGTNIGVQYRSIETQIDKTNDPFQVSDIDLLLGRTFALGHFAGADHSMDVSAANSFPLSQISRYEGYRSVPGADATLISSFFRGRVNLSQSLGAAYVINTFRFSPTSFQTNPDLSQAYTATVGVNPVQGLNFSVGGSVKSQGYLDGTRTLGWSNFQSVAYAIGNFSMAIRHVNGNHLLDDRVDLWFVDKYRRLVSVNIMAIF